VQIFLLFVRPPSQRISHWCTPREFFSSWLLSGIRGKQ